MKGRRFRSGPFVRFRRARDVRFAAALAYVFLTAVVGISHRMPVEASIAASAVVRLPDGSVADICQRSPLIDSRLRVAAALCDACLLSAAPGLLATAPEVPVRTDAGTRVSDAVSPPLTVDAARSPPSARAPPLLVLVG